jgi:ferredoxin
VRIEVDAAACTGHGRCYTLAPLIYEPDDDGYCATRSAEVPPGLEPTALAAARSCPERAITVLEG